MQQQSQLPLLKVAVIGSGGVGKSALTLQFMYEEFVEDYEPTKADSYRKKITVDGDDVLLDILDTAGQEDYSGVRDYYYRGCHAFLLVYSADDLETLKSIPYFYEHVLRVKNPEKPPMVLVANKVDLIDQIPQHYVEEGRKLAQDLSVPFLETSAKTRKNLHRIFNDITQEVYRRQLANAPRPKAITNSKRRKKCTIL